VAQAEANVGRSVVSGWPLKPERVLRKIVTALDDLPQLRVFQAEFDVEGESSYVEVKLTRRSQRGVERDGAWVMEGFGILLSRLAPIAAAQSRASITRHQSGGWSASSRPSSELLCRLPVPGFPDSFHIGEVLQRFGYVVADPAHLLAPIAPGLVSGSLLNDGLPPWEAFDAWFHWCD